MLILPEDPELASVEFDEEFWSWWAAPQPNPAGSQGLQWGSRRRPSAGGAAVIDTFNGDCERYLAVLRCAGLDMGLSGDVVFPWRTEQQGIQHGIHLLKLVGRIWSAISTYGRVVERFSPNGPWQLALAFIQVKQTYLGGFARGWENRPSGISPEELSREASLLLTREIPKWPASDEDSERLAVSLGGWVEDGWGSQLRRFLVARGPEAGRFDRENYAST
jgi:hypothetical protein